MGTTMSATYAYADPPYLGQGKRLYGNLHEQASDYDNETTHRDLVNRLVDEYPDGWAMSLSTPSLPTILPMCPAGVRICAWVKPFAVFKPNVNPAYTWEPVIVHGGRNKRDRTEPTVKDHLIESITMRKGLVGAKPLRFCYWVMDLLGYQPGDTIHDLFPGTGVMGIAIEIQSGIPRHDQTQFEWDNAR